MRAGATFTAIHEPYCFGQIPTRAGTTEACWVAARPWWEIPAVRPDDSPSLRRAERAGRSPVPSVLQLSSETVSVPVGIHLFAEVAQPHQQVLGPHPRTLTEAFQHVTDDGRDDVADRCRRRPVRNVNPAVPSAPPTVAAKQNLVESAL
ncbi:hypothetical protein Ga0074812_125102 [Parafrankia irregularis]|uniref:Uncharacterized protein n=1 Tax=Parafrankia irregularis TaxID=795642 RepID=A0A0S4QTZ1_9ACTN|nr:hypothetical protein ACG83_37915 [Frankia sp. R43]CUU59211.1 hypothetical protein Ga0074812_125102 [Parafrankia irregularis]